MARSQDIYPPRSRAFPAADIADALAAGLTRAAEAADMEQSPFGIDALEETAIHPLLAAGLRAAGWGVATEQRYPAERGTRQRSYGERCDLVVTPDGRALRAPDDAPDLFAPADAIPLAEALWMEVKTARAFHADGPNGRYVAELLGAPSEDIVRLGTAQGVHHAMLALVLFSRSEVDARAHLAEWERTAHAEGLPIDTPRVRCVAIADRIGHGACAVATVEVGRLG